MIEVDTDYIGKSYDRGHHDRFMNILLLIL